MYNYWAFGLNIASEIEFPEFLSVDFDSPDITISMGDVPQQLSGNDVVRKVKVSMNSKEYLQEVVNVAHYYVANGNQISIRPQDGADEKSIRLFTLSNAMAAILHQRNSIPLHASGVYFDGGVVLFCGHTGAGKSTMVTMLQNKGYKVFSDDVCVLKAAEDNDKTIMAVPSYPMMKLWADSFVKTGLDLPGNDAKLRPQLAKFGRFYHDDYQTAPMPIKRVFILNAFAHTQEVEIKKLGAIEAFTALQQNTYRHVQMKAMKKRNHHFAMTSKLAAGVQVYRINRMQGENTLNEVVALVEANLRNER